MGLVRTVSEINGDFSRKSQNFSTRVFSAPAEGVPLELGISAHHHHHHHHHHLELVSDVAVSTSVCEAVLF